MKIKIVLLLLLLPALALLSGCSAKGSAAAPGEALSEAEMQYTGSGLSPDGGEIAANTAFDETVQAQDGSAIPADSANPAVKSRKLIKTADVEIRADKSLLDGEGKIFGAAKKVDELLKQYGAYSERSTIYEESLRYVIRVPQGSYDAMLSGLSVLGKLSSRVETAEDVTLRYYDLTGRLATKKNLLETFQSYLTGAQTIEDIMSIETRIAELQNEIDWLGTQLAELANLTDYATINLSLYSSQAAASYTLGDRIADLFDSFAGFASGALVVILGIVVFGIPIVLLVFLAFWLLFGRIGILRKAFRFASGRSNTDTGSNTGIKKE